ncbi:uncharacterized protein CPUR_03152 [Claviceps purpurea 20.1]|uniref:Uncharacterized protein n=1 Tax=Claviceps purpurea (strain 20.1) TaxID=1111077 RepID=M1WDH6_CLAP2|nr:uncharacterized protein CPUR_03152 [Claviceps purpurea 20.1]
MLRREDEKPDAGVEPATLRYNLCTRRKSLTLYRLS